MCQPAPRRSGLGERRPATGRRRRHGRHKEEDGRSEHRGRRQVCLRRVLRRHHRHGAPSPRRDRRDELPLTLRPGPHTMRQSRLSRIRSLCSVLLRWQVFPGPRPTYPFIPRYRATFHPHLHRGLGRRRGTGSTGGRRDVRPRFVGRHCRPHWRLPDQGRSARPLHQHVHL